MVIVVVGNEKNFYESYAVMTDANAFLLGQVHYLNENYFFNTWGTLGYKLECDLLGTNFTGKWGRGKFGAEWPSCELPGRWSSPIINTTMKIIVQSNHTSV